MTTVPVEDGRGNTIGTVDVPADPPPQPYVELLDTVTGVPVRVTVEDGALVATEIP